MILVDELALSSRHDSASRWIGDFLDKRMRSVIADVVRAGNDLESLQKQSLQLCLQICEIEAMRKAAVREIKQSIAEDAGNYGKTAKR